MYGLDYCVFLGFGYSCQMESVVKYVFLKLFMCDVFFRGVPFTHVLFSLIRFFGQCCYLFLYFV
jgi:hypothetical protein